MKDISVKALAKINLGLDVVRKREDGYHEVRMVMQTIHLFDRLEISKNTSGEGYNTFSVGTDWVKCEFTFTPAKASP